MCAMTVFWKKTFTLSVFLSTGVSSGLRDLWNGGKDAGGEGSQLGEAAAGSPPGEPRGDSRTLSGGPQTLHQRVGRSSPTARIFCLRLHPLICGRNGPYTLEQLLT